MIRAALWLAALGACALSFAMNGYFWHATMAAVGWQAQALAVSVSALSGIFKSVLPAVISSQRLRFGRAWPLWLLFAAALAFDLASGLGFSRMSREGASHEGRAMNARIIAGDRAVKEAEAARDRLGAPRVSIGRLEADVAAAEAMERAKAAAAGQHCDGRRAHTDPCREAAAARTAAADARGALADAQAYAQATADVAAARAARAALGERKTTDPQAEALAAVFGSDTATAALAIGLLMLLIIEIGSTAAVSAAHAYRDPPRPNPTPSHAPSLTAGGIGSIAPLGSPAVAFALSPAEPRGKVDIAGTLEAVRRGERSVAGCVVAGPNELHVTQSALAAALGTSKPTVSRALKGLQGVSVSAGRSGTVVKYHLSAPTHH
jgi:hypothetical protein